MLSGPLRIPGRRETARPLIDAKRHALKLDWPSSPKKVKADPVRLVQIVTNWLNNSAKYTDPEGIITFTVKTQGSAIIISVPDTGIGLAPTMLNKVFEIFSQAAPRQKRSEGDLGIGLALVKGLVEHMGGSVEARSEGLERGCEFIVTLPGLRIVGSTDEQASASAEITVLSTTKKGAHRR